MDEETLKKWEKSKRIDEERMKAARNLARQSESKANQAFLAPEKTHGFSRDPNAIMKSAERMANTSMVFTLMGILFGIFLQFFSIIAFANQLGLAGTGVATILGIVHGVGMGVGILTGVIALGCSLFAMKKTNHNIRPTIITSGVSLALIAIYYIVQYFLIRNG